MQSPESNATCLHFIVSASEAALTDCLNQVGEGDSIVFIDSGVMHLVNEIPRGAGLDESKLIFCLEDLEARGLTALARQQGVKICDDRAIARLLPGHPHCLTWK